MPVQEVPNTQYHHSALPVEEADLKEGKTRLEENKDMPRDHSKGPVEGQKTKTSLSDGGWMSQVA